MGLPNHSWEANKLQEDLENYSSLLQASADSIIIIKADGTVVDLNGAAAQRLEKSRNEIIAACIYDFLPRDIAASRRTYVEKAFRDCISVNFEDIRQGRHFDHTIYPVTDVHGKVSRLILIARDITDRKSTEQALKESEARFAAFMRYLPGAAFLKKSSGEFVYVNETWERASRMKRKDIYGKSDDDVWPADIAAEYKANDKAVRTAGSPLQFIQTVPHDDGLHHWFTVKFPIFDDSGDIVMIGGIGIDITEQERIAKELQETERRFKLLVDTMNEGTAITDSQGVIRYVNKKTCGMLEYSENDLIGRSAFDLLDQKNREIVKEELLKRSRGERGNYEVSWTKKNGSLCPTLMSATPLFSQEGAFDGSFAVLTDITELKRAEEALRLGVEILHSMEEGVSLVRADDLVIVYANPKFEEMLGYDRNELLGKHVSVLNATRGKGQREIAEEIRESLIEQRTWKGEVLNVRKDGTTFWSLANISEFEHGEYGTAYLTVQRDITDRKKASEELNKYRDHLEEVVAERTRELSVLNEQLRQSQKLEAVGLLAGGIAHDFRNILTTIKGSTHIIQKKLDENSPLMKYTEQIILSVGKASNLTQSLLAFSRKQTVVLKPLDFNDIIRGAAKLLSQLIGEHIELNMMLTDKNSTVLADRSHIEQIMLNLATNARDAMPKGGTLTIQTEIIKMDEAFRNKHGYGGSGQYVLLTVSDTGTGMDEETKRKIYEPFFTTKELDKGSGLGLAVTYGIVKQHGGYIDAETFPLKGTTFKIYIPVVETTALRPKSADVSSAAGRGETILLAEDDADAREIMAEVLRLSGYTVIEAKDGEDAVRLFRDKKGVVDLVFLDVRMPKKDGSEAYEEIMKASPETAVLFMSGYTKDIIDSQRIIEQGLHFISKAASPEEMLKKIREVLDKQK